MEELSTKDKILEAAFDLFSRKGYDGVGVDEIAEAVGMKGPSLYRHFKGKEAILDSILNRMEVYYEKNFGSLEDIRIPESLNQLVEMSLHQLQFTIHDPRIKKCRKVFNMEQFRSQKLAETATKHSVTGLEKMYTKIFEAMIKNNLLKEYDPAILAMEYVSAVTVCIQIIDREPEREAEQFEKIKIHFQHFVKVYEK